MHKSPYQCQGWKTTWIHSDEEGEKEAKRQRSEPTTPISTSSRLPYDYDQMMGITQVSSGETEGFEEGADLVYHDAAEDPSVLEPEDNMREAVLSHGGCGSSSLRECIELLSNPQRKSPATCHSGPNMENRSGPSQVMSPNVKESQDNCGSECLWFDVWRPTNSKGRNRKFNHNR